MGRQVRSRVPFAYWTIDLPPNVWARQVLYAAERGYTAYKFKGRPWWDPIEQVEAVAKAAPPGFRVWIDFNGHLREARQALPVLEALSGYDCVGGFESPIPQRDVEGYRRIREFIRKPIALHYGSGCCHVTSDSGYDRGIPALSQIRENLCDGFVLGGADVDGVRAVAAVCAEARKPFWIQTVGTGLRAAWIAHLASTCPQGLLSHLAAHDLWLRDVPARPLRPRDGWLPVPDAPGLGVQVDEDALASLAAETPAARPKRISTVAYPSGVRWHFANEQQRHEAFYFGHLPGFVSGIRLEVRDDDGSRGFADLHTRCEAAPVVE
jgi:L-alanine-DL-glutamate epimerase-like enolase superfamily enzyme